MRDLRHHDPPSAAPREIPTRAARPRWYAHPYNRAEIYRLAAAMAWLPRATRLGLARRVGLLASRVMPAERAVVGKTLGLVTGATGRRLEEITAQVFGEFAMCFSDLLQPPGRLLAHVGTPTGVGHLRRLEGPVISLTAHVGNWDLAGRLLARHSARPTHVVVAVEDTPMLERWLRRDGDGLRFVPRVHPTVSLTLGGDVSVPFFGRPAPFPVGPFRLAGAVGVPVLPAFCTLAPDRRYAVTILEPLAVTRGGEEDALRAWVAALERVVRERPTQWFNFFDIWSPLGA
ncbi:MAG: hypothetical protein DME06_18205 [Candidatus Rokuibacteriota bacterium]|nr:MAG: hypothetical protein DME06_18205 [Candidatus Rokubacteria bacterium]